MGKLVKPAAAFVWISRTSERFAFAFPFPLDAATANARAADYGLFTNEGNVIAVEVHAIKKGAAGIVKRIAAIAAEHL